MVTIPLDSYNALTSKYGTEVVTLIGKREYDIYTFVKSRNV